MPSKILDYREYLMGKAIHCESGCWLWPGAFTKNGYGHMGYFGKTVDVHRVSYLEFTGDIPEGKSVLHTCDNPKCFSPHHLFLGTQQDNMRDKIKKNRDHNKVKMYCPRGHSYGGRNLIIQKYGKKIGRACRECVNSKARLRYKHRAKKKLLSLNESGKEKNDEQ